MVSEHFHQLLSVQQNVWQHQICSLDRQFGLSKLQHHNNDSLDFRVWVGSFWVKETYGVEEKSFSSAGLSLRSI